MRIFLCLIAAVLLQSCGTTYVEYDYDKKTNFSEYRSYNFDMTEGTGLSEFDERRLIKYTDSSLQSKGLVKSETPSLYLVIDSETFESRSRNTLGIGVGGGGGNVGVGVSGGIPIGGHEENLLMTLALYDAQSNSLLWEAKSESAIKLKSTPDQRDAYFKKLVAKIFKKYPPQL